MASTVVFTGLPVFPIMSFKSSVIGLITKYRIVLFSKSICEESKLTKDFFDAHHIPYKSVEVDNYHHSVLETELRDLTGWKHYPYVFINGKVVGSSAVIMKMHKLGLLQKEIGIYKMEGVRKD